jgi:hypothetical protein
VACPSRSGATAARSHISAPTICSAGRWSGRPSASSLTCAIQIAHPVRSEVGVGLAGRVESMPRSGWPFMKGEAPFMPRGTLFMLDTIWAGEGGPPNPNVLARDAYADLMRTERRRSLRVLARGDRRVRGALDQHAAAACDSGRLAEEPIRSRSPLPAESQPVRSSTTRASATTRPRRRSPAITPTAPAPLG